MTFCRRAEIFNKKGDYEKELEDLNQAMALNPKSSFGFNGAAWLYATCPKDEIRNGAKALELANKACDLSNWKDFNVIDTLAAAEAENGKFDDAMKHQQQAISSAQKAKTDEKTLAGMRARLALYQQQKPYRDNGK